MVFFQNVNYKNIAGEESPVICGGEMSNLGFFRNLSSTSRGKARFLARSRLAPLALISTVGMLAPGCAFQRQISGMAIEHNEFVAQATNRQTVLNILRAREREPMHFTTLTTISGKVQGTGQVGFNVTANGDGGSLARTDTTVTNAGAGGATTGTAVTGTVVDTATQGATNWAPSAQVSVTTGTDFQIGVNATQDFYRGIMTPLSPGIIVYYLREGFPADLITHLVVRRLTFRARITAPDGRMVVIPLGDFNNAPDDPEQIDSFARALRCWQLSYAPHSDPAVTVPAPAVRDLSGLTPEVINRLRVAHDDKGETSYVLEVSPARTDLRLALEDIRGRDCQMHQTFQQQVAGWTQSQHLLPDSQASRPSEPAPASNENPPATMLSTNPETAMNASADRHDVDGGGAATFSTQGDYFTPQVPPRYKSVLEIDIVLRSVEGVLYYLGEYIRRESPRPLLWSEHCPTPAGATISGYCIPIVRVLPASQVRAPERFAEVVYRGRAYAVPITGAVLGVESGRSSQSISIVEQLLNLHRSASELPTTPLVHVVN